MKTMLCSYCSLEVPEAPYCVSCGAPLREARRQLVGQKVGPYYIEEFLAGGAMGRLYRAISDEDESLVVVKVLRPSMASDPRAIRRFRREAEAAARLSHPHAVSFLAFGVAEEVGIYLVMEFVEGRTLLDILNEEDPFTLDRSVLIVSQICDVLEAAHISGIVHRDIKPSNIMLQQLPNEPDFVKVCDFGVAKVDITSSEFDTMLTMPGMLCGTPGYIAPEQCRGQELDGRADLFSTGVLLYEMLARQLPVSGESPMDILVNQFLQRPRPLSQTCPYLQDDPRLPAVESVIMRCLEKEPAERYLSAAELKNALLDALQGHTHDPNAIPDTIPISPVYVEDSPLINLQEMAQVRQLCQQTPRQEFRPGDQLFPLGSSLEQFYLVSEGEICLLREYREATIEVDLLRNGEFLGVPSFFTRTPSPFGAEAKTEAYAHVISRSLLAKITGSDPQLAQLIRHFYHAHLLQDLVRYSPFFAPVPPEQRSSLLHEFELTPFGPGRDIMHQGEPGDGLYLVVAGNVEVYWPPQENAPQRDPVPLSPGDFFGEMSLLTGENTNASVRSVSNTVLLVLPRDAFKRVLSPYPQVLQLMLRIARQRAAENIRATPSPAQTLP